MTYTRDRRRHLDARAEMTPDPGAIRDACMSNISRALWDVDLEQEDMPGALDAAGGGRLAQLLRGALVPIVDAPADRPSAPKGCCSATTGRRRVAALAMVLGLLGTASVAAGAAKDVSLRGRVSDAGGEPLVGVAVTAVATDVADLRAATSVKTTTDAAGEYELVLWYDFDSGLSRTTGIYVPAGGLYNGFFDGRPIVDLELSIDLGRGTTLAVGGQNVFNTYSQVSAFAMDVGELCTASTRRGATAAPTTTRARIGYGWGD